MDIAISAAAMENSELPKTIRLALLSIYAVVLVGGALSTALMITNLKSNVRSVTTTAVINLIIAHSLFLLTVPFRIYFYAKGSWQLSPDFCRVVSAMIHAHIYLTFVFYIIILVSRYLAFYKRTDRMEFYRRQHAVIASASVWLVLLVGALPAAVLEYGSNPRNHSTSMEYGSNSRNHNTSKGYQCFRYGGELNNTGVAVFNYVVSGVIISVTVALACCQGWILAQVYRTYRSLTFSHQEFWAQVKSLSFVAVMALCFVPCHIYRIYYVKHLTDQAEEQARLENINELFLAVSALSCMDMLIFTGRGSNSPCSGNPCRCCV